MAATEFEITSMAGTVAWARVPARSHGSQSCDRHGRMERLDPEALTVELNGVTWTVDGSAPMEDSDDAEIHACWECVDEALRTYDRKDAGDLELLQEAIAEEWTNSLRRGQMDRALFSVQSIDEDATLLFCPYCSDHLEADGDAVECSVHGRMRVDVEPGLEVPEP